ncbi:carboxypeptidase-like regulatory domain-containing protein [Tuwongella immobilis]|uniref:N,N-dimethylformamidase beta subunit-like C-terminal domain-containing protein n=1 Tax=Tuwongella immobilis TaxID=692036 RepID=A0A6C2YVM2_9BACT|nr:carboxypeptidase-like regulatory domain-containing protein [Tuwongella immobilis]VIP05556.1 Putative large subunit of N,N-dimethylformamidase OS=uncultured bacterium PE=4 SV=1 [Tuwongella immobilis]VTS08468.1 Putative large subunit of N,N-dimethylformamidase OS=uncultured bacterium PE=4 SV=1 [Tuwongella immobilis]
MQPIAFVSDEMFAALEGVALEFRSVQGHRFAAVSTASGAVLLELPAGEYSVALAKAGFGSKRVTVTVSPGQPPLQFRLLRDGLLGYAWPKWVQGDERVQFRVHSTEAYKLSLWRYGLQKEFVQNVGWYDNHGPRASMQIVPDGFFAETGVRWKAGHGVHGQTIVAPNRSGLYYFHAETAHGEFFSFPLVVAPKSPTAKIAVLASTNTWNAYNPFGGRSNYILASCMPQEPIVNSQQDLPRYRSADYGEWKSGPSFDPLSFDRPEPYNHIPESVHSTDLIEGRQACHLAEAEWRLLAWLEREDFAYDFYSDAQLHDGTLDLSQYRVLVISTHPEYWSVPMFRKLRSWVFEQGGRLMYLGGNGLNCAVEFVDDGRAMVCLNSWPADRESRMHAVEASEASVLGVVYTDAGAMTAAPYQVLEPGHWVFAGTGLEAGDLFGEHILAQRYSGGASGHETDKTTPHTPPGVTILARGLNPDNGGAEMVCFETPSGGQVFSVGSITYPTGLLIDAITTQMTRNVLQRFLAD